MLIPVQFVVVTGSETPAASRTTDPAKVPTLSVGFAGGGGAVIVTVAEPDLLESSTDEAEIVAVPAPVGVKIPALLTAPMLVGLTDQLTALL
jgi:hypothetical protein